MVNLTSPPATGPSQQAWPKRRLVRAAMVMAVGWSPCAAVAAEPPCLTPSEFTALATYALPNAIGGAVQRCAAALPADSYLRSDGAGLAARYAAGKETAWPGAKAAFIKLFSGANPGTSDITKNLPDATLQQIVDTAVVTKVSDALPVERCGTVSHLLKLLAPLPPESTAGVIALAIGLGASTGHGRIGKIMVCPE